MQTLSMLLLLLLGLLGSARGATQNNNCQTYPCLIFEDNFDSLDFDTWQHEMTAGGGGNNEFQVYRNSRVNSFTRNGKLFLRPSLVEEEEGEEYVRSGTLDIWGGSPANLCTGNQWHGCYRQAGGGRIINPVHSARVRSVNSFNFRYGRIVVRAKMPAGDWMWPAIWMMPKHNEYGEWPASGEIDLVEIRGNRNLKHPDGNPAGIEQMGQTMHWGPKYPFNGYPATNAYRFLNSSYNFASHFHEYRLDWSPTRGLEFFLNDERIMQANPQEGFWEFGKRFWEKDGKQLDPKRWNPWKPEFGATRLAPFDKPFHLIMNVAIGGTNGYIHDSLINYPYPKPWKNDSPRAMEDFYKAKDQWHPTWLNDDSRAMQIDFVRVWKLEPDP